MIQKLLRLFGPLVLLATLAGGGFLIYTKLQPIVAVAQPTRGPAVEAVYATGTVEPVNFARIAPLNAGRLTAVLAKDGQKVGKGTALGDWTTAKPAATWRNWRRG